MEQIGTGGKIISQKEKEYVMNVLNSNRLSYGEYSKKFEHLFSSIHGCKFGILSNSGTSSLEVAVVCLKEFHKWNDNAEILIPATTFVASSNVVIGKMVPVFVDVDPVYYEIDPSKIEEKITSNTKCIMVVHLFGQPCDMNPIREIANKYDLKIIEDSCETMFAKYNGVSVGALGDIACFSMYAAHILTTGVGGISTTNDANYAVIMRSLVNHGRNNIYVSIDDDKNVDENTLSEIIEKRFQFVRCGYSYRITEMEAALGVAQLENWNSNIDRRKEIAETYSKNLLKYSKLIQLPKIREGNDHVFMMYPMVIINKKFSKKEITNFLEQNNIETRDMLPLVNQPMYVKYFGNLNQFEISRNLVTNGFFVGSHNFLTNTEVKFVILKIQEFLDPYL